MFYSKDINPGQDSGAFVLNALTASEDIYPIFKKHSKGYVHSVFNSSFNIAFGEHLVHIGAVENGVAPFGIGLEEVNANLLTKLLAVNLDVYWDGFSSSLIFPKGISLSFHQVKWTSHKVQPLQSNMSNVRDNYATLANTLLKPEWQTGLAETENEKKRIIQYILDPSSSVEDTLVLKKLENLKELACNLDSIDAKETFDYWIGRGLGLTPTGDDIITGISAVLSSLDETNQIFLQQLKSYLIEHGSKRTTDIAHEYLHYATDNKFHSHLQNVSMVLDKPSGPDVLKVFEEMKGIGHTSGADTLVGVLIGINAVIHKKKGDCY